MKSFIRIFVMTSFFLLSVFLLYSQDTYLISQGGTITTCDGILYDSGGAEGDYLSNRDDTITIYATNPDKNVVLLFEEFNLESSIWDKLSIYDGNSLESPVLYSGSYSNQLQGERVQSTGNCLTIRMSTDGSVNFEGFKALISCEYPCQNFYLNSISSNPSFTDPELLCIDICPGETILFSVDGEFPENENAYYQETENLTYSWRVITNDTFIDSIGYGMNEFEYDFDVNGGYLIYVSAFDTIGCPSAYSEFVRVRTALPPDFSVSNVMDSICPGTPLELNGGFTPQIFYLHEEAQLVGFPACIEDVLGVWQSYEILSNSMTQSGLIQTAGDISSICMEIEHSYIGDIDIVVECPNGQRVTLFNQSCSNTYFGEPNESNDCVPGIGYSYCWKMDAESYVNQNCDVDNPIPAGDYLPDESFEGFIGCPINGEWSFQFYDNLGIDDGTVFSASIELFGELLHQDWVYANSFDISEDSEDLHWYGNGVANEIGDTTFAMLFEFGDYDYQFSVTDQWGCTFDTTFNVAVIESGIDCPSFCNDEIYTGLTDTINDGSGDFYPSLNNTNCSWLIAPNSKSENQISFRFNYFDLYENDFLYIYDGEDELSPLLGEYSSYLAPPEILTSTSNIVSLVYVTDGSLPSPGWEFVYETVLVDKPIENMESILIFPNPANDQLNIVGLTDDSEIVIYDLSGKVQKEVNAQNRASVDISDLAAGLYFVNVNNESKSEVLKFIKQ